MSDTRDSVIGVPAESAAWSPVDAVLVEPVGQDEPRAVRNPADDPRLVFKGFGFGAYGLGVYG